LLDEALNYKVRSFFFPANILLTVQLRDFPEKIVVFMKVVNKKNSDASHI